jgi:PIN domain nuclease of toxin-antitoxin system
MLLLDTHAFIWQAKLLSKDRNLKKYPEVEVVWNSGK